MRRFVLLVGLACCTSGGVAEAATQTTVATMATQPQATMAKRKVCIAKKRCTTISDWGPPIYGFAVPVVQLNTFPVQARRAGLSPFHASQIWREMRSIKAAGRKRGPSKAKAPKAPYFWACALPGAATFLITWLFDGFSHFWKHVNTGIQACLVGVLVYEGKRRTGQKV